MAANRLPPIIEELRQILTGEDDGLRAKDTGASPKWCNGCPRESRRPYSAWIDFRTLHLRCNGDSCEVDGLGADEWPRFWGLEPYEPPPRTSVTVPGEEPPWPTLDEAALYGLAGEIVCTIEPHSEADPAAILLQLLAMFGNAIGRSVYFRVEAERHYANLFLVLVGRSSKARKGVSAGYPRKLVSLADSTWAARTMSGLSSGEGLIWPVRDTLKGRDKKGSIITLADGVADKRACVIEGEFGGVLKMLAREGNVLSAVVREAWDGHDLQSLTKNSPVRATAPHISIVGHITRDELVDSMLKVEIANGFGNRFLWACVDRSKSLPDGGSLGEDVVTALGERLKEAYAFATGGTDPNGFEAADRELRRDRDAQKLWVTVYEDLSESDGGSRTVQAITGRAEAQVMRVALIYAILDKAEEIKRPHLEAALALWRYCAASAAYVFRKDEEGRKKKPMRPLPERILMALRSAGGGGLTRTGVSNALGRNVKAKEIEATLHELAEKGLVVRAEAEATRGRPAEVWHALDPPTLEDELPSSTTAVETLD